MGTAALLSVMHCRGTHRRLPQQKLCMNIPTGVLCIKKVIYSLFVICICNPRKSNRFKCLNLFQCTQLIAAIQCTVLITVTVVSLTQCLTSYVGSQVLSSGNIVCEAYQSDITGSAVVLMNNSVISTFRYSM
jgi:hypothetical protein